MSHRHLKAFTVIEITVALAIASILALLVLSMSGSDAQMHKKVVALETLQEFEIARMKEFSDPEKFSEGFNATPDTLLQACRANPCDSACTKTLLWRPLAWKNIPIYIYKVLEEEVNDGGRYRFASGKFERCEALPRTPQEELVGAPPRYPAGCYLGARAEWRSGPYGTLEYRFNLWDSRYALRRTLMHYESPYAHGRAHSCQDKNAVYCKSAGAYLLSVDFEKGKATCADPTSEVNYR